MTNPQPRFDAQAIIEEVRENHKPVMFDVLNKSLPAAKEVPIFAVREGLRLEGVKEFFDAYLEKPERFKGTSHHHTLASLLAHAAKFSTKERSSIFADIDSGKIQVIYDYHTQELTSFNEFRSEFTAEKSEQWETWMKKDGEPFSQAEFAEFIETNAVDMIDPPSFEVANYEPAPGDHPIIQIARMLNTKIASASKMIELARGLSVNEASTVRSHFLPGSGEMQLEYMTEHKDSAGKKLNVPGMFLIAIPVFYGDAPYRIPVRLRYRITNGKVFWIFTLYQPDKCVENAFTEMCAEAAKVSELPLYHGLPE